MGIRVYNTYSKSKEEFIPRKKGKVGMYVCGITPYDKPHLGHARCYVVFDCIYRYLKHRGYDIKYIQNFTDIDDKIIKRSKESGMSIDRLVEKNCAIFMDNMGKLNIKKADHYPRVTEHIKEIIKYIEVLIAKDFAYVNNGSVYYAVRKFPGYGRLSGRNLDELISGARVEVEPGKRDPLDFAMWKKVDAEEPGWESPWGRGRPGWHIECSTMAVKYLGEEVDIHGGGQDLIFPHHENEIAQSEGFTGKGFVKYWIHNGFITINKEKMSKSLGNISTIDDLLDRYPAMGVRLFLLNQHYHSPIDFGPDLVEQAVSSYKRISESLYDINFYMDSFKGKYPKENKGIEEKLNSEFGLYQESMDDDFNTARALGNLNNAINILNANYRKLSRDQLKAGFNRIVELFNVLGVDFRVEVEELDKELMELINKRETARKNRDWKASDKIRQVLLDKGIIVEDTADGPRWKKK